MKETSHFKLIPLRYRYRSRFHSATLPLAISFIRYRSFATARDFIRYRYRFPTSPP